MTTPTHKTGLCKKCKTTTEAELRIHQKENGYDYAWVCQTCSTMAPFGGPMWIPKDLVESRIAKELCESLPVIVHVPVARCVVCGARGVEEHHWAPRAMFGLEVSRQWPTDWLCKEHHDLWHSIVTPQLVNRNGDLSFD
jgi:hypothetical protein